MKRTKYCVNLPRAVFERGKHRLQHTFCKYERFIITYVLQNVNGDRVRQRAETGRRYQSNTKDEVLAVRDEKERERERERRRGRV